MQRSLQTLVIFLVLTGSTVVASPRPPSDILSFYYHLKKEALEKSPDIQGAQATAQQRDAQFFTAITRWVPRLDLQVTQSRSKDYSLLTGGQLGALGTTFAPTEINLRRWDLKLSMPLYKRAVHLGLEQSLTEKRLAQEELSSKIQELEWHLHLLFGNYLYQAYREATLKTSIDIAKTNLKEAQVRFTLGDRTRVDVLRAQAHLQALESKQLSYEQNRMTEFSKLLEYVGLTVLEPRIDEKKLVIALEEFTDVTELSRKLTPHFETPQADTPWAAADSKPYKTILLNEEVASKRAKTLMAEEWPELALQGSVNKQGPHWDQVLEPGYRSYSIALVLNVPLFSGGSTISSYFEKRGAQLRAEVLEKRDLQHLKNEIEDDRRQVKALQKMIESLSTNVEQHEEIVRLSLKSYQLGKATLVEVLSSQTDLVNAKLELARSKIDLAVLLRKLAWNLGVDIT